MVYENGNISTNCIIYYKLELLNFESLKNDQISLLEKLISKHKGKKQIVFELLDKSDYV